MQGSMCFFSADVSPATSLKRKTQDMPQKLSIMSTLCVYYLFMLLKADGSEGLYVYVSKKWTQEEIEAAERKRLDELETTMSMRTSTTYSHSTGTRHRGIMHHNRILYAM